MAQVNIAQLGAKDQVLSTDKFLIWPSSGTNASTLAYTTVGTLSASVATLVQGPVQTALSSSFIAKPTGPTSNNLLYYNGTEWVPTPTGPTGTIVESSLATGAVTEFKIATGAVTSAKIASSGIDAAKVTGPGLLPAGVLPSIDGAKITNATITNDKIAASKIAASNITGPSFLPTGVIPTNIDASKISGPGLLTTGVLPTIPVALVTGAYVSTKNVNNTITISTSAPAGGINGDIWIRVPA